MSRTTTAIAIACLLAVGCDSNEKGKTADKNAKAEANANAKAEIAKTDAEIDAKEAKAAPPEPDKENFGAEFCATIIPCFEQMKFSGNLTADVTIDLEPDGSVSAVSITGDTPKPVQACITASIEKITPAEYNGKPGRQRCTKSGQLMGGTRMIMSDSSYEVRDTDPAPGDGKADTKAG